MATALFQSLASSWDAAIATGVTTAVQNAIAANAETYTYALTLFFIVMGTMVSLGKLTWAEFVYMGIRAGFITLLMTGAGFSTYIQKPLMDDIPNWIATSVNGGFGAKSGPQQFDALRDAVVFREAIILQQASGLTQIAERIRASFLTAFACFDITLAFFIWMTVRGMIGLMVAITPFLLAFYLFNATRHIAMNLAGIAVSLLILLLLISTLLSISLTVNAAFEKAQDTTNDIEVQLDIQLNVALFFLLSTVMTVAAPVIAATIGRGWAPSFMSMATAPANAAAATARGIFRRRG